MDVKETFHKIIEIFFGIWDFELFTVGERHIAISNLVIAAIVFIVGLLAIRIFGRSFRRVLVKRFKLEEGSAATIQSVVFYVLLAGMIFFALSVANIPLTVFTLLGGAIALGVGFGSQNIVKNFISGLILLIERPIQVGHLIDVDSITGVVQSIGTRSTIIRSFRNIDIVIPNSSFLEKNVINWTLGDDRVKKDVKVGVAYGSPVKTVTELLYKAAMSHDRVLKEPEPMVLFADFGDNALHFEVYFWTRIRSTFSLLQTQSDIRTKIDELFRDHHITIAFPQRDVHFDAKQPIPVQLLDHNVKEKADG